MNWPKKSIEGKIRKSLLGYTIFIVVLLWTFQIAFINTYYQTMQRMSILRAGKEIIRSVGQENFEESLESICFEHRMCSMVVNEKGESIYSVDMMGRICLIHSPARFSLMRVLAPVVQGQQDELVQKVKDEHFHSMGLIYAKAYLTSEGERRVIVLNAALEPIKSTEGILKSQLWIITAMLAVIAVIISKLIARNISRPLQNISDKARRLAEGEYAADYDGAGIAEIDELAETLNFAAEGLSKVEELRRELVANVSHDLKTPLTMIKAYAEMIRDLTGDNPQKRGEQLNVIISEADRLTALVSVLIRISQDEREERVYQAEPFDLEEMIREVVRRFAQTNPDYQITCTIEGTPVVLADRESIGQVLYNLISNAIKFSHDGGLLRVCLEKDGGFANVEITDNGAGISEEALPRIFEKFYQGDPSHSKQGNGLGLAIVKEIIQSHGENIDVVSTEGVGTEFIFSLPKSTNL